jgi:hypothetical protein
MDRWKWIVGAQAVVIVSLVLFIILDRREDRFASLGNHDGDGWYLMVDNRTGQVCYGGPASDGNIFDRLASGTQDSKTKSYKGTGMPYCKDLR